MRDGEEEQVRLGDGERDGEDGPMGFEAIAGWGKDVELSLELCTRSDADAWQGGALALEHDGVSGSSGKS